MDAYARLIVIISSHMNKQGQFLFMVTSEKTIQRLYESKKSASLGKA